MKRNYFFRDHGRIYASDTASHWKDAEQLTRAEGERLYREQAKADLRALLRPGMTVYTCLRHRAASGMSRRISLHVAVIEERTPRGSDKARRVPVIRDITHTASIAMDYTLHDSGAIVVGGCGMDMGFHLVYTLGRTLWPNGSRKGRGGNPDRDGGYSLNHEWV